MPGLGALTLGEEGACHRMETSSRKGAFGEQEG